MGIGVGIWGSNRLVFLLSMWNIIKYIIYLNKMFFNYYINKNNIIIIKFTFSCGGYFEFSFESYSSNWKPVIKIN